MAKTATMQPSSDSSPQIKETINQSSVSQRSQGNQSPIVNVGSGGKSIINYGSKNPQPAPPQKRRTSVTSIGQTGGITAETVNINIQQQPRTIQIIEGKITLIFSGKWKKHPGGFVPISWNKGDAFARIFISQETEKDAILFSLENIKFQKLPDDNLQVTMEVKTKTGTGAIGHDMKLLTNYNHLSIYIPFISWAGATFDNILTLRESNIDLFVNGDRKSQFTEAASFEVPIIEGKAVRVLLGKKGLFTGLY